MLRDSKKTFSPIKVLTALKEERLILEQRINDSNVIIGACIRLPAWRDDLLYREAFNRFEVLMLEGYLKGGDFRDRDLISEVLSTYPEKRIRLNCLAWHLSSKKESFIEDFEERCKIVRDDFGDRLWAVDVVNEAFHSWTWKADIFLRAFEIADRYFPNTKLFYCDYAYKGKRWDGILEEIINRSSIVRIDGVAIQCHSHLCPFPDFHLLKKRICGFKSQGFEVHLSENVVWIWLQHFIFLKKLADFLNYQKIDVDFSLFRFNDNEKTKKLLRPSYRFLQGLYYQEFLTTAETTGCEFLGYWVLSDKYPWFWSSGFSQGEEPGILDRDFKFKF